MARTLDGDGEGALALRGQAGLAARLDLAPLRKEPAQAGDILVINLINTIGSEDVHTTATAAATAEPTAATEAATATTATTKPTATAAAIITETTTTTAVTAEAASAAPTIATTFIGTGRAILTRRAVVRCPLRALLISHGLFLLKHACYCA